MFLTEQVLATLLSRTLVLDCPSMTLVPMVEDGRVHYKGAGYIAFDDGGFNFKLLTDQAYEPGSLLQQPVAKSGQFLGDSDYYTLYATDVGHQVWQSSEVFPKLTKGAGIVANGKLDWIRSVKPHRLSLKENLLHLWFPEKLRLPYNQTTRSVAKRGKKKVAESWKSNSASFSSSAYDLTIGTDQGWTVIEASKAGELPESLAACLQESLAFILGRSIQATVIQAFDATQITTTIVPSRLKAYFNHAYPPLAYLSPAAAVWRMYECFFRYWMSNSGQTRPHLAATLQYVLHLFGPSLDAQALAFSVAVEGLLSTEYTGIAQPPEALLAELKTAEKILRGSDLSSSTVNRIVGSLGGMRAPRAKDRLLALAQSGIIAPSQVDAWNKLRNSVAHAKSHEFDDAFVGLCHEVLALLYCLTFNVIGYVGPFTDYGTMGWPEKEYPFTPEAQSPHNMAAQADT